MQSLLIDVEENVPKDEEAFQKVEDERIRSSCNFRKLCDLKLIKIGASITFSEL